jgi:hypothetical protein
VSSGSSWWQLGHCIVHATHSGLPLHYRSLPKSAASIFVSFGESCSYLNSLFFSGTVSWDILFSRNYSISQQPVWRSEQLFETVDNSSLLIQKHGGTPWNYVLNKYKRYTLHALSRCDICLANSLIKKYREYAMKRVSFFENIEILLYPGIIAFSVFVNIYLRY